MYIHTHTYIQTCIHTYIHTCTHAYIQAYIHTYMQTYMHTYIHTYIHTYPEQHTHQPTNHPMGLYKPCTRLQAMINLADFKQDKLLLQAMTFDSKRCLLIPSDAS